MTVKNNAINTGSMTNGQIKIGSTGQNRVSATITPAAGIGITNGPGSILLSALTQGGKVINVQYLTGTGTYTPTTGTVSCFVVASAGGGGGSGSGYITSGVSAGSGGGGGATGFKYYKNVSSITGTSYSVGVGGVGGTAGTSSTAPGIGGTGGSTTFANGDMNLGGGLGGILAYFATYNTTWYGLSVLGGSKNAGDNSDYVVDGSASPIAAAGNGHNYVTTYGYANGGSSYLSCESWNDVASGGIFRLSTYGCGGPGAITRFNTMGNGGFTGSAGAPGVIIVYEYGFN